MTCELDRDDRMWLESLNLIKFLPPLIKTGDRDVLGLAKRLERQGTGTLVTQALGKNLTTWRDHLDPMSSRKPINRMPARIIPAAIALDGGRVEGPSSKAAEHQKMKAFGRDCRFLNRLKVVVKYPGRRPTSKLDTDPPVPKPDVHMFIFSNDSRKNLGP